MRWNEADRAKYDVIRARYSSLCWTRWPRSLQGRAHGLAIDRDALARLSRPAAWSGHIGDVGRYERARGDVEFFSERITQRRHREEPQNGDAAIQKSISLRGFSGSPRPLCGLAMTTVRTPNRGANPDISLK
jgi:hypothetical protein